MSFWDQSTALVQFAPFIELSFASNVAYSAVRAFGNLNGVHLNAWAIEAKVLVIPALQDTVDQEKLDTFAINLDARVKNGRRLIAVVNKVYFPWAVIAAAVAAGILICVGFWPNHAVSNREILAGAFFLIGAVALGLLTHVLVFGWNKVRCWMSAWRYIIAVWLLSRKTDKAIETQRKKMREKLLQQAKEAGD